MSGSQGDIPTQRTWVRSNLQGNEEEGRDSLQNGDRWDLRDQSRRAGLEQMRFPPACWRSLKRTSAPTLRQPVTDQLAIHIPEISTRVTTHLYPSLVGLSLK